MKYYLRFILVLLPLFFDLAAQGQNQATVVDSIEKIMNRVTSREYDDLEETIEHTRIALALAKENRLTAYEGQAQKWLTRWYAEREDYLLASEAANEALQAFQEVADTLEICNAYSNLGIVYRHLSLYEQSIAYFLEAEAIAQQHKYSETLAHIYGNLGNVYYNTAAYDQALTYHFKSLKIDQARADEEGVSNSFHNIANIYLIQQDYAQALDYYQQSLAFDLAHDNWRNVGRSYLGLTKAHLAEGDVQSASAYAYRALAVADSIQSVQLKTLALKNIALTSTASGDYARAFRAQEQVYELQDSVHAERFRQQLAEMQTKYETERKDKDLALQDLQINRQNTSLLRQRVFIYGLIGALLLLSWIAYLLFNRYRLKQRHRQIVLENKRTKLAENLSVRQEIDDTINYFATSLFGKNTVDEILWDIAHNCIARLGLVDCVIYLTDSSRQVLEQKAAYGIKNSEAFKIHNPIEIPWGKGIVGIAASSGETQLVDDTSRDSRYIVDDARRLSELAVPIKIRKEVVGVIDSEHPERGFFTPYYRDALKTIAAICASKIVQAQADEEAQKAEATRREAEQLKALDSMKSRFFANISHEFRTPLHLILGPLQTFDRSLSSADLSMMQRNAQRLLRLVNQLLDLAKLEVGQLQLNYRQADIFMFLRTLAASFTFSAESKKITYQVDVPLRRHLVRFDPDKLEKIVYNLLSNAIKFTPLEGTVTLHAAVDSPSQLRLSVSDTGLGVPADLRDKIFDRFYQVDDSNTRTYEGTGIGLALIKELVELHGGTIALDSEEQRGTSFTLTLPLQPAEGEQEDDVLVSLAQSYESATTLTTSPVLLSPNESEGTPTTPDELPLVLLVEDNTDLRHYIRGTLADTFAFREAIDGQEGWDIALECTPDLIVTDVMMPVMDGIALTHQLKSDERTSHIPVVMLTARDDVDTKRSGFRIGADQYLTKPFDSAELRERLSSLIRQRSQLRERYGREITLQPQDVTLNDRDATFLERCLHTVEQHLSEPDFGVEQFQRAVGMSRTQLHRKLKALTNQSTTEFIRDLRLQRAAQLLQQPGVQVSEVVYNVGFSHLSYFARCFKEKFGLSPSDYLKKVRTPA